MEEETTTLYLWDIDSDVSEPEIFDFFDKDGETSLTSVEVHRDDKKKSLGRASLIFKNPEDASTMMRNLSEFPLNRKQIQMSLSSFPEAVLAGVNSDRRPLNPSAPPYVPSQSNLEQGAQSYMPWPGTQSLWNLEQGAQSYMPWPDTQSLWKRQEFEDKVGRSVYVSNFLYELTEDDLKTIFLPYGEIISCKIRRHPFNGKSQGDGFVEFSTHQQAVGAIALNGNKIDGRVVYVSLAKSKANLR